MIGRKFGHYVITGKLGAGGMGEVYRAHDEHLDRDVALKVLPAGVVGDEAARKQFRKEALALAKLNHPNIETIFEFGTEGDIDFLAMELVPGKALDEMLVAGPLPEPEIIKLGSQFADGLAAAHDQGIIHRDLKPGNLFVTPDGRVKILDFGLAKLLHPQLTGDVTRSVTVQSGSISGTVPYMSPEQLRGLPVDIRSDIYGAGAVLYEMASGQRPYPQTQTAELMGAILLQPLPPVRTANPNVSVRMERVISKALEKEPAQRFQTAREMKAALQSAGMSATVTVDPAEVEAVKTRVLQPAMGQPAIGQTPAVPMAGSSAGWAAGQGSPATPQPSAGQTPMAGSGSALVSGSILGPGVGPPSAPINAAVQAQPVTLPPAAAKPTSNRLAIVIVAVLLAALAISAAGIFGARQWIMKQLHSGTETAGTSQPSTPTPPVTAPGSSATTPPAATAPAPSQPDSRAGNAGNAAPPPKPAAPKPTMPANAEAARFYSDALEKLRGEDDAGARDLLQKSITAEPNFALSHAELAAALGAMGYEAKARAEGETGFKMSSSAKLRDADRALVEARYRETTHEWSKAAEIYASLVQAAPDNAEYGLGLAAMQIRAGKAHEALGTLDALKKSPGESDDPRIDEMAASADEALGQYKAEQNAAGSAVYRARTMQQESLAAGALLRQAWAQAMMGQSKDAIAAADESQRIYASAGDTGRAAEAMRVAATLFALEGNFGGAKSKFEQALAAARQAGDNSGAGENLYGIAGVQALQGDLTGGKKNADDAVTACRAAVDRGCESFALATLAEVQFRRGNLQEAQGKYQESLAITKDDENSAAQLSDLLGMSRVLYTQGDLAGAQGQVDAASQALQDSGDAFLAADAQMEEGRVLRAANKLDDARKSFEGAMNGFTNLGAKREATIAQVAFAGTLIEQGKPTGIEAPLRRAIAELQAEKDAGEEALARAMLARGLLAMQSPDKNVEAQKEVASAIPIVSGLQDPRPRLELIVVASRAAARLGGTASATKTLEGALTEAQKYGFVPIEFEIRLALGEIEIKGGKADAGKARLADLQKDAADKGFLLVAQKAQALSSRQ